MPLTNVLPNSVYICGPRPEVIGIDFIAVVINDIKAWLLHRNDIKNVVIDGGRGVGLWTGFVVMTEHKEVNLHVTLPFPAPAFTARWDNAHDRNRLMRLIDHSRAVDVLSNKQDYTAWELAIDHNLDKVGEVLVFTTGREATGNLQMIIERTNRRGMRLTLINPYTGFKTITGGQHEQSA